jgi:hypothetical protein
LQQLDAEEFHKWTLQAIGILLRNRGGRDQVDSDIELWHHRRRFLEGGAIRTEGATSWAKCWPQYREGRVRLLASFEGFTLLCLRGLAIQPIATPGFVGVIDMESAIPDVSRRHAISADVTDVLARANVATRPQIVENLNALAGQGLLIDKLDFLARCVSIYGRQTILEASVPWISLLKLPGEVELLSCAAMLARLTKSASLFVAFGTGPWTAMKRWVAIQSQPMKAEPAIVLDDSPLERLGYLGGSEERIGKLSDLWPRCSDTPLFGTILRLAAEAWQSSLEDLSGQEGWRHDGSSLWGRLSRP